MVLICDHCLTKECADGDFFCEEFRAAGLREVTDYEYKRIRAAIQGTQDKSKSQEKKDGMDDR